MIRTVDLSCLDSKYIQRSFKAELTRQISRSKNDLILLLPSLSLPPVLSLSTAAIVPMTPHAPLCAYHSSFPLIIALAIFSASM